MSGLELRVLQLRCLSYLLGYGGKAPVRQALHIRKGCRQIRSQPADDATPPALAFLPDHDAPAKATNTTR